MKKENAEKKAKEKELLAKKLRENLIRRKTNKPKGAKKEK